MKAPHLSLIGDRTRSGGPVRSGSPSPSERKQHLLGSFRNRTLTPDPPDRTHRTLPVGESGVGVRFGPVGSERTSRGELKL